jgi:hypothetical protein
VGGAWTASQHTGWGELQKKAAALCQGGSPPGPGLWAADLNIFPTANIASVLCYQLLCCY